ERCLELDPFGDGRGEPLVVEAAGERAADRCRERGGGEQRHLAFARQGLPVAPLPRMLAVAGRWEAERPHRQVARVHPLAEHVDRLDHRQPVVTGDGDDDSAGAVGDVVLEVDQLHAQRVDRVGVGALGELAGCVGGLEHTCLPVEWSRSLQGHSAASPPEPPSIGAVLHDDLTPTVARTRAVPAERRAPDGTAALDDADRTAADVAWELDPLLDGRDVDALLDEAGALADEIEAARGTVAGLDAAGLAALMQ